MGHRCRPSRSSHLTRQAGETHGQELTTPGRFVLTPPKVASECPLIRWQHTVAEPPTLESRSRPRIGGRFGTYGERRSPLVNRSG